MSTRATGLSNRSMPRYPSKVEVRVDSNGNTLIVFGEHLSPEEYSFALTPEATARLAQGLLRAQQIHPTQQTLN